MKPGGANTNTAICASPVILMLASLRPCLQRTLPSKYYESLKSVHNLLKQSPTPCPSTLNVLGEAGDNTFHVQDRDSTQEVVALLADAVVLHDLHSIPHDTRGLHLLVSDKNTVAASLIPVLVAKIVQSGVDAGYRVRSLRLHTGVLQFQKSESEVDTCQKIATRGALNRLPDQAVR